MRLGLRHRYLERGTLMVGHETYFGFMIHWETGWVFHACFKQPARPPTRPETFMVVFQLDPSFDGRWPTRRIGQAVLRKFYSQYRIEGIGELKG